MGKRPYADAMYKTSQASKILNLGKKSWASGRAISVLLYSLR